MSGTAVRYTIPAGVTILDLKYRESGYDTDFAGSFQCDDGFYNRLWDKARRTLYVNMRDTYFDCPDRERAQWWGDIVIDLGEAPYALDRRADRLVAKGLRELAAWQRADGTLYAPVPDGNWNKELPPQMLASVGWYGAWTYYLHSGDADTIRAAYPAVQRYLSVWKLDENGLVIHRKGEWDWHDWGKNIDAPLLDNAWYVLALKGAAEMARVAGHADDAGGYERLIERVAAHFDKAFWTGHAYRSPGYTGDTDDRGNAMAVLAGLAPAERYPDLKKVLAEHLNASPYMEKYVLESLFVMDDPTAALARMKKRYRRMVDNRYTTLAEMFDGGGTYNHAWSGGPLTLLSQKVAGLAPDAPAWERYTLRPQLGPLRNVEAAVPSPKGMIRVQIAQQYRRVQITIDSPPGAMGRLSLPTQWGKVVGVKLNGTETPGPRESFLIGPGRSAFEVEVK
jgi:hypothetical protein